MANPWAAFFHPFKVQAEIDGRALQSFMLARRLIEPKQEES
jgi:hypothetical protein